VIALIAALVLLALLVHMLLTPGARTVRLPLGALPQRVNQGLLA
jgi:hypothetical protein